MSADVLLDLIAKLEECTAAPEAKAEFRKMILSVGAMHNVSKLKQEQRIDFARNLLRLGEPRPLIRSRLVTQFGLSDSQASRDIASALQHAQE